MNLYYLFSFIIPTYEYTTSIILKYVKLVSGFYQPKINPTEIIPKLTNMTDIKDEYNYDKYLKYTNDLLQEIPLIKDHDKMVNDFDTEWLKTYIHVKKNK